MDISVNTLTTEQFLELYTSVGWEPPCPEQVERALGHSYAMFTACEGGKVVGMVRLLGDGGMSFYLKDFAIIPSYQGKGVGKKLLAAVREYILKRLEEGWAVSLELISTQEAVPFYKRQGFEERPCDWDGPGMFQMVRKD